MQTVVVLDGDGDTREETTRALTTAQFNVVEATNGVELLRKVFSLRPHAVLMDLQVARFDGLEMIRVLRAASNIPIVVTSRQRSAQAAVRALDMGADDFIERPTDPAEIMARLRAAIRRYERQVEVDDDKVVRTGSLVIDRTSQVATRAGEQVQLTRTEYRLLDALAARTGQVAPHRYLLSTVWGEEYVDDTHYLRVYIGYLRAKLEVDPAHPRYLINEWGTGYRLAMLPVEAVTPTTVADEAAVDGSLALAAAR